MRETLIDLVESDRPTRDSFSSTWLALSAGGPMNSAVALGKLGCDTHFLGRISRDAFGRQLRQHILEANVKLDLATESSQATSIAVVSLNEQGVASYTFHFNDTANFGWQIDDLPELASDDWLHIASLSCVVSPGAEVLLDWMRGVRAQVSYDINVRPTVITDPDAYWSKVQPWLHVVGRRHGIVKASDEDIEFLPKASASGGDKVGSDLVELAALWVEQYGLGLAVLTLGPDGAAAVEPGGNITRVPGFSHHGGRHRRRRRHLYGWLLGWLCEAAWARSFPDTRDRGRLNRLLSAGTTAANVGRGGRFDRRAGLARIAPRVPSACRPSRSSLCYLRYVGELRPCALQVIDGVNQDTHVADCGHDEGRRGAELVG